MKLTVITPVGPGHEAIVNRAQRSVDLLTSGPFSDIQHLIVWDANGKLGRSRARNIGIREAEHEVLFFLDADDIMCPDATKYFNPGVAATFGKRKSVKRDLVDIWPCFWTTLQRHGTRGTLSMGFFVYKSVAEKILFNEEMDLCEDFDFYVRLPEFVKVPEPLVIIGDDFPGTSGGHDVMWSEKCQVLINKAFAEGKRA